MKSILAALALCLISSAALSADYSATTTVSVTMRGAPIQSAQSIGTLPAGTALTVEVCFDEGAYCLVTGEGVPGKGAFVAGDLMTVDGSGTTVLAAETTKWAAIRDNQAKPKTSSRVLRTEGDSYMNGAYETRLADLIAEVTGRRVQNTAVGQSTMTAIRDRMADTESLQPAALTVIWDGSNNDMTSVSAYADELAEGIAAIGSDRFIVIPPMHAGGGSIDAVAAEFKARWPDNVLDWREVLGAYEGQIPSNYLARPADDIVHLNATAMRPMADAIAAFIVQRGW